MDAHEAMTAATVKPKQRLFCSFCGAADDESEVMIAGDFTYICGVCVDLCTEIMLTYRATKRGDADASHEPPNVGIEPPKVGSNDGLGPL